MQHVQETLPHLTANGGCYNCRNAHDGVVFDAVIEGEGVLFICARCIKEASQHISIGRAREVRARKQLERDADRAKAS